MIKLKCGKEVSVCFSGHRDVPFAGRMDLKQRLKSEIAKAYADGYRCFYCGMAMGFDLLAAEAALSLQSELEDLQIVAVVPFRGQSERWSTEAQAQYNAILRIVDDVVVLSEWYYNGCLLRRNDYMVNHSSRLIAYHDGINKGGTFYTVKKAGQNGLKVVNLYNSLKQENLWTILLQLSCSFSCSESWAVCSRLCSAERDETISEETADSRYPYRHHSLLSALSCKSAADSHAQT